MARWPYGCVKPPKRLPKKLPAGTLLRGGHPTFAEATLVKKGRERFYASGQVGRSDEMCFDPEQVLWTEGGYTICRPFLLPQ